MMLLVGLDRSSWRMVFRKSATSLPTEILSISSSRVELLDGPSKHFFFLDYLKADLHM